MNRLINIVGLTLGIVLASLLFGCEKTPEQASKMDSMKESMSNSADKMKESASETADSMKESMGEMKESAGESSASMKEGVGEFKESADQYIDDAAITGHVKEKLVVDPTTKAYQISVETHNGTVQLSGFVQTAEEKGKAGEIAAAVPGVKSVKNDLILKSKTESKNDSGKIRVA